MANEQPPLAGQQVTDSIRTFSTFLTGLVLLINKAAEYQLFAQMPPGTTDRMAVVATRLAGFFGDSAVTIVLTAWASWGIAVWRRSYLKRVAGKVITKIEHRIDQVLDEPPPGSILTIHTRGDQGAQGA